MDTMQWVLKSKIIAIVRGMPGEHIQNLAEALLAGGIDLVEVTFDQARPETWVETAQAIRRLSVHTQGRVLPGAGTVLSQEQLKLARDAGARYIITPNTNPGLIGAVKSAGLACFPGALTPTEIVAARDAGADAVKVFPAGQLGPGYLKAIRAPLSHIPLMAVGGVTERNAGDFLSAGCVGLGVGGNLVNQGWIAQGQWENITALAREYRKAVDAV